jgi:hypothetical protein
MSADVFLTSRAKNNFIVRLGAEILRFLHNDTREFAEEH